MTEIEALMAIATAIQELKGAVADLALTIIGMVILHTAVTWKGS